LTGIASFAAPILGESGLIIVDVGAAHGLPLHLHPLEPLSTVCLFEPHKPAAQELRERFAKEGRGTMRVFEDALASSEGDRTLFVTNAPTGSSLLKPGNRFALDFGDPNYFYPIREISVHTRRLEDVMADAGLPRVDAIKIDVQGAELFVLQGMGELLRTSTVSVEAEIGFPGAYIDQPGFGEVNALMVDAGFDLYDLRLASHHRHYKGDWTYYPSQVFRVNAQSRSLTKRIAEADAVYFRRVDLLCERKDTPAIRRLLVCMCAYGFFVEALHVVETAKNERLLSVEESQLLRGNIVSWHQSTKDLIADSIWFGSVAKFFGRASRALQRRALGRTVAARWSS
jgi:FkbM family methyltransferase